MDSKIHNEYILERYKKKEYEPDMSQFNKPKFLVKDSLIKFWSKKLLNMYAILDIETTGGKYDEEGITEIAIYRHDGESITDQFSSLVNPQIEIQPFVQKLTGISTRMLQNAPKFYEIAKRIVQITEDCVIVAHNASFDYRILQTEFRRLGFPFERKSLCTVSLSKILLPDQPAYSLGKLIRNS